jgi:hypothetical protein
MRLLSLAHAFQAHAESFSFTTSHDARCALTYDLVSAFRLEATELSKPFPKLRPILAHIYSDVLDLKHAGDRFDYSHTWNDLELNSLMNPCYSIYLNLKKHVKELHDACGEYS